MTNAAQDLVRREVRNCVSSLVSALAEAFGATSGHTLPRGGTRLAINDLTEQAAELAAPVADYEEAAREAGWRLIGRAGITRWRSKGGRLRDSAEQVCAFDDIKPHYREVYEHWIVSDWLADKLIEKGEKVDKAFAKLIVWARTSSEPNIADDIVIHQIAAEMNEENGNDTVANPYSELCLKPLAWQPWHTNDDREVSNCVMGLQYHISHLGWWFALEKLNPCPDKEAARAAAEIHFKEQVRSLFK
jgi:hypothetical protein